MFRQYARDPDKRLWWRRDPWTIVLSKTHRDGGWFLHSLAAHPRASGGDAFTFAGTLIDELAPGPIQIRAGHNHLANIYERQGFDRTGERPVHHRSDPDGSPFPDRM